MLVECGFARALADDGSEWTFTPSFARIAALGDPEAIVSLYADLHGPRAAEAAVYILSVLCDQDDPTPLIGWLGADGWHDGAMPPQDRVILAMHLMRHGIAGNASPGDGGGQFSTRFDAAEYVAAARVHLGLSSADAEALSMTEFLRMFEMKFPKQGAQSASRDVPTRAEYDASMAALRKRRADAAAARAGAAHG